MLLVVILRHMRVCVQPANMAESWPIGCGSGDNAKSGHTGLPHNHPYSGGGGGGTDNPELLTTWPTHTSMSLTT